ncbi:MAG: hypothetical protein WCC17_15545, partial [Candidatus Nitrosopolaris sp.]
MSSKTIHSSSRDLVLLALLSSLTMFGADEGGIRQKKYIQRIQKRTIAWTRQIDEDVQDPKTNSKRSDVQQKYYVA